MLDTPPHVVPVGGNARRARTQASRGTGNTVALSEDVREIQVIDEGTADAPVVVGPEADDDLGTQMRVRKRDGSLEAGDLT